MVRIMVDRVGAHLVIEVLVLEEPLCHGRITVRQLEANPVPLLEAVEGREDLDLELVMLPRRWSASFPQWPMESTGIVISESRS